MSDYTPTTADVRRVYCTTTDMIGYETFGAAERAEFDRWLAKYTAEKRAEWEAERRAGDEATRRQIDRLASDYYEAIIRAERAEQGETEWEYGYELIEPDTRDVFERDGHYISTAFAYRAAKMRIHEERHPGVPGLQYSLIQRAKAGPWLPVPATTNERGE